ncbi:class I adenylate-forming enzyme family protein [Paraburkholderia fungorum]|uniref:class I adenylate-forming enzyme family protein n=1 Tax=Paraburkholderia fungorum TaxID=134537 RepID=UPI0038B7B06F
MMPTILDAPRRPTTLADAFDTFWRTPGAQRLTALRDGTQTLSYTDLETRTRALAGRLLAHGAQPGEALAISMNRSLDAVLLLLAAIRAGLSPCVLEPRLAGDEARTRVAATAAAWLVYDDDNAALAGSFDLPGCTPLAFDALCIATPADALTLPEIAPDTPALLLFTSGSTGQPKVVQLTQAALLNNALGVIDMSALNSDDRLLHVMPIYHTNGVNNQLFAPLLAGSMVLFCSRFRAADMPALLDTYRPTIITGVPTMYSRMLSQSFDADALAGLRMARCGSAPITETLHREVEAKLGCPLVVSYGLSEATCTSTLNPPQARRIGSVGKVLAGQTVELRAPDGSMSATPGVEGEICIGGANLMNGYLGAPDATARAVTDNWLRTGDLGRFDDDGYLSITGRIKDVIIRGGENLSPLLIESAIVGVTAVSACCVVGMAERDLGEVPVAFVVADEAASGLSVELIQDAVREHLSRIYVPYEVFFVDALPETAVGKVDRKVLAARLAAGDYAPRDAQR